MNDCEVKRSIIDQDKLPPSFPTHRHSPQFWEQLGRTIATYGFLEEVLGKAIFAFTATRNYSPDEINEAYQEWLPKLERALTDQLWNLAESYGAAARDNPATTTQNVDELVENIKRATAIRNVLCHGSWRTPNANGASMPLFVNRQKQVFDTEIDIAYLKQVQAHVVELACSVIDSITHMGWQFPGGAGRGKPIWERSP
jgi:NAD-dependent SIR2 family protein deacetylase